MFIFALLASLASLAPAVTSESCPSGFHHVGARCYYVGKDDMSWKMCHDLCYSLGADMASLETCREHEELANFLLFNTEVDFFWVGAERDDSRLWSSDQWIWRSGSPLTIGPPQWYFSQPDDGPDHTHAYIFRDVNYKIYDAKETDHSACLCEVAPKGDEFLQDYLKKFWPLSSGSQVSGTSNRVTPCPRPFRDVMGLCLHIPDFKGAWDEARLVCQEQGGDLAVLSSCVDHSNVARDLVREKADTSYWLGARDVVGYYQWVTGAPLASGSFLWEPRYPLEEQGCLLLYHPYRFFATDSNCTATSASALCQYFW
ncbi:lymphocyte antigen 75-like isoform X2 [Oratosquilla oratoria]|uniref:lymphocyte antigen 75-like isoform X2 n=1 Tax=Oratosquilla oratoria TaxID=337810 RepID=UPI003F76BF20